MKYLFLFLTTTLMCGCVSDHYIKGNGKLLDPAGEHPNRDGYPIWEWQPVMAKDCLNITGGDYPGNYPKIEQDGHVVINEVKTENHQVKSGGEKTGQKASDTKEQ
jgi:hypothetical protein